MKHFYIVSITVIYGHMAVACYPHNNIHLIIFNCLVPELVVGVLGSIPAGTGRKQGTQWYTNNHTHDHNLE